MEQQEMDKDLLVRDINTERTAIKHLAAAVKRATDSAKRGNYPKRDGEDAGETIANLMLAYRHLEDASMRLGKAIQARDGGTSVYDRATVVGA